MGRETGLLRSAMYFSLCVQRPDGNALVNVEAITTKLSAETLSVADAIAAPQSGLGVSAR